MDFLEKTKGVLLSPSKTFDAFKEETLNEAIKYFIILAVIFSALTANLFIISPGIFDSNMGNLERGLGQTGSMILGFIMFFLVLILLIIYIFVAGAFTHIFVYLVGGRKGFSQTLKAVMYCQPPSLLIGWIPYLIIISIIWTAVLEVIGIRQLQEISTGNAILATIILPSIIIGIIFVIIIISFAPVYG